jgi:PAS domain S-box-containing protein
MKTKERRGLINELKELRKVVTGLERVEAERKKIEKELKKSEREKALVLDNTGEIIAFHNTDHKLIWANKAYLKSTGLSLSELRGKKCYEAWGLDKPCNSCPVTRAIETGEPSEAELTPQNQSHWPPDQGSWLVRAAPVKDENGNVIGAIEVAYDITERKEAEKKQAEMEEEKKKMQAQLLQSQKMEAIGRLAGGIAHDFNNLLTAIIGYGQLLHDGITPEDPRKEMMEEIINAANQAAALTGQLLAFSRKKPVKLEVIDVNSILKDIEGMIGPLVGEDIDFSSHFEEGLTNVRGDTTQIEQVILNLIVNAREAMPKGGKLTLKTERIAIKEEDFCKIPNSRAGDFVCISVKDTGVGMDEERVRKIFDPFFTTKKTGTGLGLSVAHRIIENLRGWINIESEPGRGTTFKVYLPLSYRKKTKKAKNFTSISGLKGKGETILVIEDEEVTRKFITKILKENGYSVLEAENIEEATKIFKKNKDEIKMVFSDVVLSDGSGLDFAEGIIAKGEDIKILLSSGYIDEKAELSRIAEKEFEFLEKPYNGQELSRKVREALA